jgi:short-subunit dehydrogenase
MTRVAFITGASSGLGAGLARHLALRDGYAVALAARRVARLEQVVADIHAGGGRAEAFACDVRSRVEVHRALADATSALGPVDLLVANAGISAMTVARTLDAAQVEELVATNFLGAVYAAEVVLPAMLARSSGHIVVMGSLTGYGGLPGTAAYSASKGALHNFFESLRVDLRGTGVDVTVITPGYVRTELTARNAHPMPFLMELDDAVAVMARGIRLRKRLVSFPRPLSSVVWLAQVFPARLYDWMASKVRRDKLE